jgi:hypothetical protein
MLGTPWSLALLLATPAAALGEVHVVDFAGGAGSDFTDLSAAVDAAADGDVLLVRSGLYDVWNTVDGRSLTIAGDGPFVQISGLLAVQNLDADQRVVLRGFELKFPGQVELLNNDGVVWIEDCQIQADLFGGSGPFGAVHAVDSRLAVQNSHIEGSMQYGVHAAPPTAGLYLVDSVATISGGSIRGGPGVDTIFPDLPGAAGLALQGSTVTASGTSIDGGLGESKPGGPGIAASAGSVVTLRDTPVAGGAGAPAGPAVSADGSSAVATVAGAAHGMTSTQTPRVGETLVVSASGAAGDGVLLLVGTGPALVPLGMAGSVLLVNPAPPLLSLVLGTVPAGGTLQGSFLVPSLGGGVESVLLVVQDVYLDASLGEVRFGPGTAPLLLDAGF